LVTVPGNRKRKLSLERSRADEKEMDSGDIPDIQEAEEAPSAQGKVAGQTGTPAVVGVKTRSKATLAATTPAKTGQTTAATTTTTTATTTTTTTRTPTTTTTAEMVVESAQSAPNEELSEMRAAPEYFAVYKSLGGSADEAEYRRRLTSFFLHTMNSALGYDADICGLPLTATHDEKGYRFYASRGEAQRAFREAEQIDGDEFMRIFGSVDMVHPYS